MFVQSIETNRDSVLYRTWLVTMDDTQPALVELNPVWYWYRECWEPLLLTLFDPVSNNACQHQ